MRLQEQFARNLRRERLRSGLSQEALAHRCDLHSTEISRLERGTREPRLSTIVRLARALKMTPSELLKVRARLDGIDRDRNLVESDYLSRLREGDSDAADVATRADASLRTEHDKLAGQLRDLQARQEEIELESPADAALDAYNEARPNFQRIRDALSVEEANDELRTQFQAFRLDSWLDSHVIIDPILRQRPGAGIGWQPDERGDIHYLGPDRPVNSPQLVETGNYSQA